MVGIVGVGRRILLVLGTFVLINIVLDVHFPGGVHLMESRDDVFSKGFVSPHGDKCVAEEVKSSARMITLNDPEYESLYLTSLS